VKYGRWFGQGIVAAIALTTCTAVQALTCTSGPVPDTAGQTAVMVTRTWTLDVTQPPGYAAQACQTGEGPVLGNGSTMNMEWGPTWENEGEISSAGDLSLYLDVTGFSTGKSASGTWTLSSLFWEAYGEALISFHVGEGSTPNLDDHSSFYLQPGSLGGTWSYAQIVVPDLECCGGGLSNLHLWGRGTPLNPPVPPQGIPEPSSLALLGLAFLCLAWAARRSRRDR